MPRAHLDNDDARTGTPAERDHQSRALSVVRLPGHRRPSYEQNWAFPGLDPLLLDFSAIQNEFNATVSLATAEVATPSPPLERGPDRSIGAQTVSESPIQAYLNRKSGDNLQVMVKNMLSKSYPAASASSIDNFVSTIFSNTSRSRYSVVEDLRKLGDFQPSSSYTSAEYIIDDLWTIVAEQTRTTSSRIASPESISAHLFRGRAPIASTPSTLSQHVTAVPTLPAVNAPTPGMSSTSAQSQLEPSVSTIASAPVPSHTSPSSAVLPGPTQPVSTLSPGVAQPLALSTISSAHPSSSSSIASSSSRHGRESRDNSWRQGVPPYLGYTPENPFRATNTYTANHVDYNVTFYQSASEQDLEKPLISPGGLRAGDIYIHYNSAKHEAQISAKRTGRLWQIVNGDWQNKTETYLQHGQILHPSQKTLALYFPATKNQEPVYGAKSHAANVEKAGAAKDAEAQ